MTHLTSGDRADEHSLDPIAGVDMATYARVVRTMARRGHDHAALPSIAAGLGIGTDAWARAYIGWSERILSDDSVGQAFLAHYLSRPS